MGSYYIQRQDNINEDLLQHPQMNVTPCKVCSPGSAPASVHWTSNNYQQLGNNSTPNSILYAQSRINSTPPQHLQPLSSLSLSASAKKIPPEVPKRTSSISSKSMEPRTYRTTSGSLTKCADNGSLSSVQSSGSDSSISTDRIGLCGETNSTGYVFLISFSSPPYRFFRTANLFNTLKRLQNYTKQNTKLHKNLQ